jgi:hypothetical protein
VTLVVRYFRDLGSAIATSWNRFWFSPVDPATLALVRILAGLMLFYTHLVWTLDLDAFFGEHAWISPEAAKSWLAGATSWSWFWVIHSRAVLWTVHLAGLVIFAMFTLGLFSRVTSVLALVVSVAYVNRVPGALFGLDQINCMLALYVMLGPSGDAFSLDRLRAVRRAGHPLPPAAPSVGANLATRLIQVHMCVIYFFAGLSKMQGGSWWSGTALWGAFANLEYQSLDMTWLASYPLVIAFMSQVTVWWELGFSVLVWPRILRPLVLAISIPLHLGIGICLGMMTFGLVMLIGCASFLPPEWVRAVIDRRSQQGRGGQGGATSEATTTPSPRRRQPPSTTTSRRR